MVVVMVVVVMVVVVVVVVSASGQRPFQPIPTSGQSPSKYIHNSGRSPLRSGRLRAYALTKESNISCIESLAHRFDRGSDWKKFDVFGLASTRTLAGCYCGSKVLWQQLQDITALEKLAKSIASLRPNAYFFRRCAVYLIGEGAFLFWHRVLDSALGANVCERRLSRDACFWYEVW